MSNEDLFFNSLIEYIDRRIDQKLVDRFGHDESEAFACNCSTLVAKDELKESLKNLCLTLFMG